MERDEKLPGQLYPENIKEQLNALTHYYGNLRHRDEYWVDLLFAAEELIKQHDNQSVITHQILEANGFIPGKAAFSGNHNAAMEQFTLLPLNVLAPQVDMLYDINSARKWYEYVTAYILRSTQTTHTRRCLDLTEKIFPTMCRQSLECPVKALQASLVGDIVQPDFESVGFLIDPRRQIDLADMKLDVAIDNQLEYPQYAYALSTQCHRKYDSRFGKDHR